jgi:hypothetical protein
MNYAVQWTEEAERLLAAAWVASDDRAAVTAAARRIDERLGVDPFNQGESRDDFDVRIVFDRPLGVVRRVDVFARSVLVVSVGLFGRRR